MTAPFLTLLVLQGAVFAVWAYFMFRTLFMLAARARDRDVAAGGSALPGPGAMLRGFAEFATSPHDRPAFLRIAGLTAVLVFLTLGIAAFGVSRA